MGKVKGTDIWLEVDVGTESWKQVGGQKDATFDRGVGTIDTTNKDSGGNEEHLIGIRNWSISFDAFLIESDDGFKEIEAAYDAGEQLSFKMVTPDYDYKGIATVESLSMTGPLADAGVVSFSLKGTAGLTKTSN